MQEVEEGTLIDVINVGLKLKKTCKTEDNIQIY